MELEPQEIPPPEPPVVAPFVTVNPDKVAPLTKITHLIADGPFVVPGT
jgi:hypothetical protein